MLKHINNVSVGEVVRVVGEPSIAKAHKGKPPYIASHAFPPLGTMGVVTMARPSYGALCYNYIQGITKENGIESVLNYGIDNPDPIFEVVPKDEAAAFNKKIKEALVASFEVTLTTGNGGMVGSDPEVFVLSGKGNLMPAFEFLPAKKDDNGVALMVGQPYWDGFQAEYTISPAYCHEIVMSNIAGGLTKVLAAARTKDSKATLTWKTVFEVPDHYLRDAAEPFVALGCAPSMNAYPNVQAIDVPDGRLLPHRFAGFHIHHGIGQLPRAKMERIVKAMDNIVGVASVSLLDGMDDPVRRRYYGRAGEFRLPPHGLEYRVLSSAAMARPELTFLLLDLARYASLLERRDIYEKVWESPGDEVVQHIINEYDVDAARTVLEKNRAPMMRMLTGLYARLLAERKDKLSKFFDGPLMKGAKKTLHIKDEVIGWPTGSAYRRANQWVASL